MLGPNGAGKTTTLRILSGLILSYNGKVTVSGEKYRSGVSPNPGLVGSMIDAPGFLPYLSGRENLALLLQCAGQPDSGLDELIERSSLKSFVDKRYATFSHGMRQRLGMAAATATGASVILLDEPLEGLDPIAQIEARDFLKGLARQGKTIIISSHRLADLEKLCSHFVIVKAGRSISSGTLEDLLQVRGVVVQVDVPDQATAILRDNGFQVSASGDGGLAISTTSNLDRRRILSLLAVAGIDVIELYSHRDTLENLYMDSLSEEK